MCFFFFFVINDYLNTICAYFFFFGLLKIYFFTRLYFLLMVFYETRITIIRKFIMDDLHLQLQSIKGITIIFFFRERGEGQISGFQFYQK